MAFSKPLKNIDWEFFLARKNAIFYVTIYFKVHGIPLRTATVDAAAEEVQVHEKNDC